MGICVILGLKGRIEVWKNNKIARGIPRNITYTKSEA